MPTTSTHIREIRLPTDALRNLRRVLREQRGDVSGTHLLHDAGFATGAAVYEQLLGTLQQEPSSLTPDVFWTELDGFLRDRGWGRVRHERVHPGLGLLSADDWAESDPDASEDRPGCAFSAGVLAHVLGRVAQGPIAVLEVSCRSRGDADCAFLFGSEEAVSRAYEEMKDGGSLSETLARV